MKNLYTTTAPATLALRPATGLGRHLCANSELYIKT